MLGQDFLLLFSFYLKIMSIRFKITEKLCRVAVNVYADSG